MAQKKTRKKAWGFGDDSLTLQKSLQEVYKYLAKQQWSKAQNTLEQLEARFPSKKEILEGWLTFAYETSDWKTYQEKATDFALKYPDEPDVYLRLASVCLQNTYPLMALEALQTFAEKFQEHPEIPEVHQKIEKLQTLVPELLQDYEVEETQALQIGILSERGRFFFESHQYPEARQFFENLIHLAPKFWPALNNLSLICYFEGDLTGALSLAQQVLESEPNNFQALGNLVRFYVLSGETQLAQQSLNQLKVLDNHILDIWLKKAESFSLFGDWSSLVALGTEAESDDEKEDLTALFWHCVAVGYANLGQEQKARQLWEKSLRIDPRFKSAQQNFDNIKLPLGERHTPWAYELNHWLSNNIKEDITEIVSHSEDNQKSQSIAKRIIQNNPRLLQLIPILLKRGCPFGRRFAISLATLSQTPELLAALKEFAFSQEGTDQERLEVAQTLNQQGLIPSGPITIWLKGEQQELLLMGMEINDEPTVSHSPKVHKLGNRAVISLKTGDAKEAESLLTEALELEPHAPDLKFNLANAYLLQEREDEAYDLLHQIHQEHPDYTFATVSLARYYLEQGELETAEELLKPLLQKPKFNFQEISKLCETHIQLAVKKKTPDAAISWLNLWKQIGNEDDPNLEYWCRRLEEKSSWFLK